MSLFNSIKCVLCLIKCSKYLYFIKKALCILTAVIVIFTCFTLKSGDGKMMKYFRGLI